MQIHLDEKPAESVECDALVAFTFEGKPNDRFKDSLSEVYASGEVTGKMYEMTLVHRPSGFKAKRVLLAGSGSADKFTSAELRRVSGAAVRHLKSKSVVNIVILLDGAFSAAEHVEAAVEGAVLGDYEPDRYKTDKKGKKPVEQLTVAVAKNGLDGALARGRATAEAQNLTRELVNEPANRLTPTSLADAARQMAVAQGLECEVLDRDRMKQLGMGSLLGVAMGSAEPPALIILRYKPAKDASNAKAHLGLVGKGVTFDTGGISIKPADGMEKMKYDMAGGAAMIGTMRALAQLKPPIPVTAVIPAVENMPGSRAQRPGDIVTALSGKTIEVINTDAEGRLILADALTYARRLGCTHLVDAATLTGAIVVALGHIYVGLFASDEGLRGRVMAAAGAEGEKMWQMPLDEEYKDYLKSAFADLPNIGGRWGGAITAAWFLKEFAED